MKTLGAYMIVKNEESCIATCLNSIINICDEIIVVDTGCDDKTMDIVNSFNSPKIKTSFFKWVNDFSAARNYAKSLTSADYVFTTDADEEFTDGLQKYILELKENDFYNNDAIELWLLNKNQYGQDTTYIGGRTIIKNAPTAKWKYKIHEKLYNKEDSISHVPFEVGYIIHSHKSGGSTDAYNKYAEIYFNELNGNENSGQNNYAHFYYYLFFTLKNIDEFVAKTNLTGLFEAKNIIATSEDQRVTLLDNKYLSPQQFYALSMGKNIDGKLISNFTRQYPDEIAEYILLKSAFENVINGKDKKNKDYILPQFGLLSYNNGRIIDFINITNQHAKLSPTNSLAIRNLDFISNFIKPFHAKYKLVIDCRQSTEHLPSIVYYLSQYFYDAHIITNNIGSLNQYNLNNFKNIYFGNSIGDIQGNILIFDASKFINRNQLINYLNNLIASENYIKNDMFSLIEHPFQIKTALCVLSRRENKFLHEYVNYYKNIGFDKIFLYDNNQPSDNQKAIDVLSDFINDGFVEIINWPKYERYVTQVEAYQDCYDKNSNNYDWIAFFDCDEYLILENNLNIKDFLQKDSFNNYGTILFSNIDYSDSNMLENNSNKRLNVFNEISKRSKYHWYKQIIRTKLDVDFFSPTDGHHIAKTNSKKCDADGREIKTESMWMMVPTSGAYIKHIPTGALSDFINFKCDGLNMPPDLYIKKLDYYIRYNVMTPEKFKYWFENKEKRVR